MNKYLLLRDNKQSGPYTVPEIIARGMKPYDLVWLEGKSAAWRYPSEIEELKEYAPTVEEQPFDRFYKKPAAAAKEEKTEKKSVFEPVATEETGKKKVESPSGKVYINFPGGVQKKAPVVIERKELFENKKETIIPAASDPVVAPQPVIAEAVATEKPAAFLPVITQKSYDKKIPYGVAAACFVLIIIVSVLIINYGNQRSSIKQLNEMVQRMEKQQYEQNQAAKAALANRVIPTPVADEPVTVADDPLVSTEANKNISVRPSKSPSNVLPAVAMAAPVTNEKIEKQMNPPSANKELKAATAGPVIEKGSLNKDLYNQVSVKANKYKTGIFGGISGLQFVLTNNSTHELQRVAVEVQYFAPEKKLIRTQTVYFENVAPGAQPVIDVPKSARGVNIDYKITNINI